jgi:hypothetical protein
LQERQRYEQWLAALESRRATTPAHVYARVHTDYESRLAHVLDELGGRSAELRQVVDELTERVTALQSEENTHRDQRAEAELRAAVGEYSPDQWREVSQGTEADIARVAARRAEAASELAQVQQLLNMATATARRPDSATSAGGPLATSAAPATAKAPAADIGAPRGGASAGDRGDAPTFDELAFLHSVVEPKAGHGGAASRPGAADSPPARPSGPAAAPAPRAKTPAAAATAASTRAAPPSAGRTATPADSRTGGTAGAEAPADASRRVPTDSDGVPVFLRDVPSEQIKTLKCAECGNMNYPTEWYCERCGGELAAM